jgi:hypothetical protein
LEKKLEDQNYEHLLEKEAVALRAKKQKKKDTDSLTEAEVKHHRLHDLVLAAEDVRMKFNAKCVATDLLNGKMESAHEVESKWRPKSKEKMEALKQERDDLKMVTPPPPFPFHNVICYPSILLLHLLHLEIGNEEAKQNQANTNEKAEALHEENVELRQQLMRNVTNDKRRHENSEQRFGKLQDKYNAVMIDMEGLTAKMEEQTEWEKDAFQIWRTNRR